jgi:hypothetical protein
MSDAQNMDFGKFLPGFDFLQNLVKGASQGGAQKIPDMASWIAPSMNEEEIDKRISELKTVQFWLEQNSKALGATVQALEVQKMTLATLKGMNVQVGDLASAFKFKGMESMFAGASAAAPEKAAAAPGKTLAELAAEAEAAAEKARKAAEPAAAAAPTPPVAGQVDPMQLWGSLTQQFQQIAASAMKDVSAHAALDATKTMASEFVKEAVSASKKVADTVKASMPAKAAAPAPAKPAAQPAAKPAAKAPVKAPVKAAAKKVAKKTTGSSR